MKPFLTVLFLFLTISAHASFETEPVAPTDATFVVLQVRHAWRDRCLPENPKVTRTDDHIEVRWSLPQEGGCAQMVTPWNEDVPLGMLPAGEYDVVLNVDDYDGLRTVTTRTLIVRESKPAFRVEPDVVSSVGSTDVEVRDLCFSSGAVVTMDGEVVPSRTVGDCTLIVTLPPHAAGAADLRLRDTQFDEQVIAAVRYVDPAATPDSSVYERVLVPVLYDGGGAYGSEWVTEVEMINASSSAARFLPDVARPLTSVAPRSSVALDLFGNRPSGLLLFVPRGFDIRFGGIIRDLSRDAAQWGTELPIVRERETRTSVTLANVPFDSRYRVQLRIYGIDGTPVSVQVIASREGMNVSKGYVVSGPCAGPASCNSNRPAYAAIDLTREFASLAGKGAFDVTVSNTQITESPRMWGFVTVTNNVTQSVTVITPQ